MAWAVRAAQLKQHTLLVGMLGATLGCAAIFLGVKAVEYTHKWELGLLPGKLYVAQVANPVHADHNYLRNVMIVPMIYTVIGLLYYLYSVVISSRLHRQIAGPVFVSGCVSLLELCSDKYWKVVITAITQAMPLMLPTMLQVIILMMNQLRRLPMQHQH